MLIPRFSMRWLLALTGGCAVLAFVVSLAIGERVWAMALTVVTASIALNFVVFAAFFSLAWAGAEIWRKVTRRKSAASPFAMHTAPPQWVAPEEPD